MADELLRSKHGFGNLADVESAKEAGKLDQFDVLFMDEKTDPKIGWINKDGETIVVKTGAELKGQIAELEAEMAEKVSAEEVDSKIAEVDAGINTKIEEAKEAVLASVDEKVETAVEEKVEAAVADSDKSYEKVKYEFTDVPEGTLVDYREEEIRIMCPADAVFTKQAVGAGGDINSYYGTLKTYAPCDEAVGYIEHLGDQVDAEILTDLKTDAYGRRYQPSWLALAKCDDAGVWTYYGASSSKEKYIGWDYQIDWYNADGVMIASDSIRINLSNEDCHSTIEPYYVKNISSNAINEAKTYTDEQIAVLLNAFTIVEF